MKTQSIHSDQRTAAPNSLLPDRWRSASLGSLRRLGEVSMRQSILALAGVIAIPSLGLAQNQPPVADAGGDKAAYTGDAVTFYGSGSDPDGDPILGWSWTVEQAPGRYRLSGEDTPNLVLLGYVQGDYVVSLTVTDGIYGGTDYATIHVADNQAPVAVATADETTLSVGDTVCFDGSHSSDPEGGPLTYTWDMGDGSPYEYGQVAPCHTFTSAGTYDVRLRLVDERSGADFDELTITVFGRPTVAATASRLSGPSSLPVEFDGSQTRAAPGRTLVSFLWDFGDGTTSTSVSPAHQFEPELYTVSLTVTDDLGGIGTHSLQVHIGHGDNWPPVADAGTDRWVATSATTTLDGSATDADNQPIVAWSWTVVSAPPGAQYTLADPADPHTGFSAQTMATYVLALSASDGADWSLQDAVTVWVGIPMPPVANAGPDMNVFMDVPIVLQGSASDVNGDPIVGWSWTVEQAPAPGSWNLVAGDTPTPTFIGHVPGNYLLSLAVAAGYDVGIDYVTIHVARPQMRIEVPAPNTVLLAWPAAASGYSLEHNADLSTANWQPVTTPPVVVGAENQVTLPATPPRNFFRLRSP